MEGSGFGKDGRPRWGFWIAEWPRRGTSRRENIVNRQGRQGNLTQMARMGADLRSWIEWVDAEGEERSRQLLAIGHRPSAVSRQELKADG
jgi:hypothetical protein